MKVSASLLEQIPPWAIKRFKRIEPLGLLRFGVDVVFALPSGLGLLAGLD